MSLLRRKVVANRRVRGSQQGRHLLEVRARKSTVRRQRRQWISQTVLSLILWALVLSCGYFAASTALEKFFFENPAYTVRGIETDLDEVLTHEEALMETGLETGVNIFSVNLSQARKALTGIPMVKHVRVERALPDRLVVKIEAYEPDAWIIGSADAADIFSDEASRLVTSDGMQMRPRRVNPEHVHLPLIYGYDRLADDEILQAESLRAALELIALAERRPAQAFQIRSIDVSKGYCLNVETDSGTEVVFAVTDFSGQLDRLEMLLHHFKETSQEVEAVNLMARRNIPVRFVTPAEEAVQEMVQGGKPRAEERRN